MWRRSSLALLISLGTLPAAVRAQEEAGVRIEPVTDPAANSPKEAVRRELFKQSLDKPGCAIVKADPRGKSGLDAGLDGFLGELIQSIKAGDKMRLQPLFHPRLNMGLVVLDETLAKVANTYGAGYDVSIYRLWALNTVDGAPGPLDCAEDGAKVAALYGYPLQFGAWLQIAGSKEIGRIFVSIVPADGKWHLGSFHVQQWTHDARDAAAWGTVGADAATHGLAEAAYVAFDIAAKLLDGGRFVEMAARDAAVKARDGAMSSADFDKSIRGTLKDFDVISTSTLLVLGGGGVLVRIRIPEEISVERIKSECARVAHELAAKPWAKGVKGVRCQFNMPREDAAKDGALGGIYVAFADVRKK